MTVGELIKELSEYHEETTVCFETQDIESFEVRNTCKRFRDFEDEEGDVKEDMVVVLD